MSWASRRRATYATGIGIVLLLVIAIPLAKFLYRAPSCTDGIQNQGETAPDKGGPCPILDERTLAPASILWARSFKVRDGSYSATAYIENPNDNAGARAAHYRFGLYDSGNILVAERTGMTFIMPGSIMPVFEANIDTGNRDVAHTYFEFTGPPMWERLRNPAAAVAVSNKEVTNVGTTPRVEATAENTSVAPLSDLSFVAVVFSPAGNARVASKTALARLAPGEQQRIVFTWPDPFGIQVGRVDIIPLAAPVPAQ